MPDPAPDPTGPTESSQPDPPLIREFDDRSSLWLLEDPQHLGGLLQILDPDLADRLDFTHARRMNRSFIPADLQKEESDLIYAVPFRDRSDREVWVYVLLEHQSEPDPLMPLRVYLYMGELWDTQRREWEDRQTPAADRRLLPIIPVVYYTGEKRWRQPISLKSLMDLPPVLERFVPDWETLFLNLRHTPPEALTRFASAVGWALRVMQAERAPLAELEQVLREAMRGLEGLSEEQAGQWLRVAWFFVLLVLHRREEAELAALIIEQTRQSRFREGEQVSAMGQSILEQVEARGEARAAREALETVLVARFGPLPEQAREAIAAAGIMALKSWLGVAVTAPSLNDVGILPETGRE
jgi:hypothetical protein